MAAFNKFNPFIEAVFEKQHNFSSDVFKVYLSNELPLAADSVKADIAEIANGGGYTSGGQAVTITASSQSGGTYTAAVNQTLTWTATGAGIASFRYAVMYNDTSASDLLVGYWDYGSSIAPASGETFQWIMNANLISAS
jgi:predicted Zn-dependent protease